MVSYIVDCEKNKTNQKPFYIASEFSLPLFQYLNIFVMCNSEPKNIIGQVQMQKKTNKDKTTRW